MIIRVTKGKYRKNMVSNTICLCKIVIEKNQYKFLSFFSFFFQLFKLNFAIRISVKMKISYHAFFYENSIYTYTFLYSFNEILIGKLKNKYV